MTVNVNFAFVRHGYGCHNAVRPLLNNNVILKDQAKQLSKSSANSDPELTPLGVDVSIHNGCIISKIIRSLHKFSNDPSVKIDTMNIVGCSPLIRSMETAYYMTRKWKTPPNKIYVFPHLRELDEGSNNKFSNESKNIINLVPAYAMKSILDQKKHLQKHGLLDFFDFTLVEVFQKERKEPGDIINFIDWFGKHFLPIVESPKDNLNVFVVTHAGVLKDYAGESFANNSGFLLNTKISPYDGQAKFGTYINFNYFLPPFFQKSYDKFADSAYFCPSNRCAAICKLNSATHSKLKKLELSTCEANDDEESV